MSSNLLALFATCPRGVEPLLAAELAALGAGDVKETGGGVACRADQATAYRLCLWSRLASRVLLPLRHFPCPGADALYEMAKGVDWPDLFEVSRSFAVEVAGRSAHIPHSQYAGLRLKDAVADAFRERLRRRPDVDPDNPDIRLHLHLDGEDASIGLDLSGEALHRRGYRRAGAQAPLKENLAAALLLRAGWPELAAQGLPLLDPMCGSGTLVLEAALMAGDIAPGLWRERFGFEAWLGHRPKLWGELLQEARARRESGVARVPPLFGRDLDSRALAAARDNAQRTGLPERVAWEQADASAAPPPAGAPGLLITNPPYGERLGSDAEVIKLYSLLGAALKERYGGWRVALFSARPDVTPRLGLRAEKMWSLYNGAIACKLLLFSVPAAPAAAASDSHAKPAEGGDFANRLQKNLRHLSKWARRRGVTCYRLYDADLPAYAVAVDLYETQSPSGARDAASTPGLPAEATALHAHVQEYAAPKSVDPVAAERRLRAALAVVQKALELPAAHIHYKLRRPQRRGEQYERQAQRGAFFTVSEHGCRLRVNLDDYLDSGLFLDHRPLRLRLQQEADGKAFLNLFCYTGSATVHALRGGAARTFSVDLSRTYLDWAEENLRLNGAQGIVRADKFNPARGSRLPPHVLLQADCLAWLRAQAADPLAPRYDLILLDPPTFSTSKRMDETLDVQRDHVELLRLAAARLASGGTLYFSTNRRGFKLDPVLAEGLRAQDITAQTLDEDFRRPPPAHRCWKIVRSKL